MNLWTYSFFIIPLPRTGTLSPHKNIERIDDEIEYIHSTLIGKLYSAIDNAKSEKKTKVDKMKMIITNIENKYEEIIEDLESVINDTINIADTLLSHKNELKLMYVSLIINYFSFAS